MEEQQQEGQVEQLLELLSRRPQGVRPEGQRRKLPSIPIGGNAVLWLERLEPDLALQIKGAERPFLGLHADRLPPEHRKKIRGFFAGKRGPVKLMTDAINAWPAVMAVYLTVHVTEGYAQTGTAAVWPYLSEALAGHDLTSAEKEQLYLAFRVACIRLGLSVSLRTSGPNYMVEEYLRQAGVPLAYAAELASRMLRYAAVAGVPADDDPSAIRLWRDGFAERLSHVSRSVRDAIEHDEAGYYVRLFLRIAVDPSLTIDSLGEWEATFAQGLLVDPKFQSQTSRQMAVPQVVLRDLLLQIELPAGENRRWALTVDGTREFYPGRAVSQSIPLQQDLPQHVEVVEEVTGYSRHYDLWTSQKDNEVLAFSKGGAFVKAASLGTASPCELDPGEYEFLLRFVPDELEDEVEEVSSSPWLYAVQRRLGPAEELLLSRGPARLRFCGLAQPWLGFQGESHRDTGGTVVFTSDLTLLALIPTESLKIDGAQYVLTLSAPHLGEALHIAVDPAENGRAEVELGQWLAQWQPGVARVLAELRREDVRRPLARASVLVWNGLKGREPDGGFRCDRLPGPNLLTDESDNVEVDTDMALVTYRDASKRFFRLTFAGSKRNITLGLSVPGLFLSLRNNDEGGVRDIPLQKGSVLSVGASSRAVLGIQTTEAGYLVLGAFRLRIEPARARTRLIHLATLRSYVDAGDNTVVFVHDSGVVEKLVRVVAPQELLRFAVESKSDELLVRFTAAKQVQSVRLEAHDLLSGDTHSVLALANDPASWSAPSTQARLLESTSNGGFAYELYVLPLNWPSGCWIMRLHGQVDDRWGTFTNARGDIYGLSLVMPDGVMKGRSAEGDVVRRLHLIDSPVEHVRILKRLHNQLMTCWAIETWQDVSWLSVAWREAVEHADLDSPQVLTELVALAHGEEGSAASGWVPMRSLIAAAPAVLAQRRHAYRGAVGRREPLAAALALLSQLEDSVGGGLQRGVVDSALAFGFANAPKVTCGEEPRGFALHKYRLALLSMDVSDRASLLRQEGWRPGTGDYLGRLHYEYCLHSLREGLERTSGGNDFRRGAALRLASNARRIIFTKLTTIEPPAALQDRSIDLGLLAPEPEGDIPQSDENLQAFVHLLALIAMAARWSVRDPGVIERLFAELRGELTWTQFQDAMSYVLHLGMEVLIFYLLLWEIVLVADNDRLFRK